MFSNIFDNIRKYAIYTRTYNELASMSEIELRDIGISRHSIADIARETAYGSGNGNNLRYM